MADPKQISYPQISSRSYEHPADRAATSALHAIPLFDRLVKRFGKLGLETRYRQILLGDAVKLGTDQLPSVWDMHLKTASALDIEPVPLFVTQQPNVNAVTFGMRSPSIVVFSALVGDYEADEVTAVLAHENGHVLSDHVTYTTALVLLAQLLAGAFSDIPFAGLPLKGLYLALLEWSRAAELSCDRAAALAVDDPMVVCRILMRMAGGALPGMNVDAFIRQAMQYADEEDLFARRSRFTIEINRTHPAAVRRVRELTDWVQSGEFDRIRSGSYIRRGEEPPPSAEFEAAVAHYRERFTGVIDRTVGGVNKLGGQVISWLRGDQGSPTDDDLYPDPPDDEPNDDPDADREDVPVDYPDADPVDRYDNI